MSSVAHVMTELALDRVFDYAVPVTLAPIVRPGHRVSVPFGNRKVVGYVIELSDHSEYESLKPLLACLDPEPLITPALLALARWLATYYLCPFESALRTILPAAVRNEDAAARTARFIHVLREPDDAELATLNLRGGKRATLLAALRAAGPVTVAGARQQLGATPALVKGLESMGLIRLTTSELPRDPFADATFLPSDALTLNDEQAAALGSIIESMDTAQPSPFLLHGVTGSGKTEIYLQAIAAALDRGRGAIMLVPEISLTPQNVEHFKSRFAGRGTGVAVLHSHLSEGERRDEWHRIRSGAAPVVIGARSAVFAPVSPLGLLVVDEEHETSYKQGESPRYHARDVAVMRAHLERVPVLLGSATPSLESFHNARRGKYRLVSLAGRIDARQMPDVRVVDMRHEKPLVKGGPAMISRRLHSAILDRLEKAEQVMLFLNRRGFATSILCPGCGFVATCPHCSVSLTFHRGLRRLKCHLCGHDEAPWRECPQCHADRFRHAGTGTERVELGIERLYPKARIARMDSDAMTRKGAHAKVLSEFRAGRIDILVGTQMIAKGLHFPNVTLVGVVNADLALHLPDFRAAERVFQLLTQVAGRAGRGEVPGEVFVQTHTPHHPAIQFARRHDFLGFYEHEIAFREQLGYPPVRRALLVGIRSRSNEKAVFVAASLARQLKARLPTTAEITGPAPAPIEKIQDHFRHQIFVRGVPSRGLADIFRDLRATHESPDVLISVDVDPVSLL